MVRETSTDYSTFIVTWKAMMCFILFSFAILSCNTKQIIDHAYFFGETRSDVHEYNEAYFNLFLPHRGMIAIIKGSYMPCK